MSAQVAFFREWADRMRAEGFTVHFAAGWETRDAEPGNVYLPGLLYIEHHDASSARSGNWGALNYIINNRLAQIVTARDGQITICAAGVTWHAGVGSRASLGNIPKNGANPRSMGNEVCNSGSEPYDPRCTRAIIAGERIWAEMSGNLNELQRIIGHKEWADPPGRKTDPSVNMDQRRRDVAAFKFGAKPDVVDAIPALRFPVGGAIRDAYNRPGVGTYLGQPTAPENGTGGSDPVGRYQPFDQGFIFWHPNVDGGRAHAVQGSISELWTALGREVFTGFPATDESMTPDTVGRYNHFSHPDGMSIYWHPDTGAHVVRGVIRTVWANLGWEVGFGYPTTDEMVTPDKAGRYNHFTDARSIYWHPAIGAHPIQGAFREAWATHGWEAGPWGYPVGSQHLSGGIQVQDFQNGRAAQATNGAVTFTPTAVDVPAPETPDEVPVVAEPAKEETVLGLPVPEDSDWKVSSPFGPRKMNGAVSEHPGIDIAAPAGTPLLAMGDGVVTTSRVSGTPKSGFGFVIVVRHERGGQIVDTVQGHMLPGSVEVKVGDKVTRGQQLAEVGAYGDAQGPHTHVEVCVGGWYAPGSEWVDPAPWLGL